MPRKPKPLNEQTIVITGATSGIGLATASMAAEAGARLALIARTEDVLKDVAAKLSRDGAEVMACVADVGERSDIERATQEIVQRFGRIDTWVNNAGVGVYGNVMDLPHDEHEQLFRTNYWGVVHGSQAAVEHFEQSEEGGTLINVGSINSDFAIPLLAAYAATKHAVKGFTDGLRMELQHKGSPVQVTLIKPSGIGTPFSEHARNHTENEPQVAPPVYAPEVVAKAILHAATHSVRDVTVGGAGRFMVASAVSIPNVMDRFFGWAMPKVQQTDEPKTPTDNLFEGQSEGRLYRKQGPGRKFSTYTAMAKHPLVSIGTVAAVGAGVAAYAMHRRNGNGTRSLPFR